MDRLRAARGNLHALVPAQLPARTLPELLPVGLLHEAVLGAQLLQARDGHVAEAREHLLHEVAGLLLGHRRHAARVRHLRHEDVVLRRQHKRLARRVVGELVAPARGEVHRHAAVEVVARAHLAQPPRGAQHKRALVEGKQTTETANGLLERARVETDALDEGQLQAVLRGLLQGVAHGHTLQLRAEQTAAGRDRVERAVEVGRLHERIQQPHGHVRAPSLGDARNQLDHLAYGTGRPLQQFIETRFHLFYRLLVHVASLPC